MSQLKPNNFEARGIDESKQIWKRQLNALERLKINPGKKQTNDNLKFDLSQKQLTIQFINEIALFRCSKPFQIDMIFLIV